MNRLRVVWMADFVLLSRGNAKGYGGGFHTDPEILARKSIANCHPLHADDLVPAYGRFRACVVPSR